jgi:hypothetical protein
MQMQFSHVDLRWEIVLLDGGGGGGGGVASVAQNQRRTQTAAWALVEQRRAERSRGEQRLVVTVACMEGPGMEGSSAQRCPLDPPDAVGNIIVQPSTVPRHGMRDDIGGLLGAV